MHSHGLLDRTYSATCHGCRALPLVASFPERGKSSDEWRTSAAKSENRVARVPGKERKEGVGKPIFRLDRLPAIFVYSTHYTGHGSVGFVRSSWPKAGDLQQLESYAFPLLGGPFNSKGWMNLSGPLSSSVVIWHGPTHKEVMQGHTLRIRVFLRDVKPQAIQ